MIEEEDGPVLSVPAEEWSTLQAAEAGIPDYATEATPAVEIDGEVKLLPGEDKLKVDLRAGNDPGNVLGANT